MEPGPGARVNAFRPVLRLVHMPAQHYVECFGLHENAGLSEAGLSEHVRTDEHDAFFSHGEALGVVGVIFADDRVVGNHATLVNDGPADAAFFANTGGGQQNRLQDFGAFVHGDAGEQQGIGECWRLK